MKYTVKYHFIKNIIINIFSYLEINMCNLYELQVNIIIKNHPYEMVRLLPFYQEIKNCSK